MLMRPIGADYVLLLLMTCFASTVYRKTYAIVAAGLIVQNLSAY